MLRQHFAAGDVPPITDDLARRRAIVTLQAALRDRRDTIRTRRSWFGADCSDYVDEIV